MEEVVGYLRGIPEKSKVLVLCHHNADLDGSASAVVLAEVLRALGADARAGAACDVSSIAQAFLKSFGRDLPIDPPLDCELIIMVDTSSFGHLGKFGEKVKEFRGKIAVMDHHHPVDEMRKISDFYFVREEFSSMSEVIFRLMEAIGISPSQDQASLLLGGIVADTAHFKLCGPETFGVVDALIKAGANYKRAMNLLHQPEEISKRIAMLKAAQRLELRRIGEVLLVFSELGSFEGDAANVLVRIGADLAFVGNEEKGSIRVSGRGRPDFIEQSGVNLGEIFESLAKEFGGSGGGHPGAASMTVQGNLGEIKERLFNLLREKLS